MVTFLSKKHWSLFPPYMAHLGDGKWGMVMEVVLAFFKNTSVHLHPGPPLRLHCIPAHGTALCL